MGSERLNNVGGLADLLTSCNILVVLYLTLTLGNCVCWDIFAEIMLYRVLEGHVGSTWPITYGELTSLNPLGCELKNAWGTKPGIEGIFSVMERKGRETHHCVSLHPTSPRAPSRQSSWVEAPGMAQAAASTHSLPNGAASPMSGGPALMPSLMGSHIAAADLGAQLLLWVPRPVI